jgi:hypothetical protein
MLFWLVLLILEIISYNRVIINILKDFWFLLEAFFEDYIFAW